MKKIILLLILVLPLLSACKKDEKPAITWSLLAGRVWKHTLKDKNPSTNPPGLIRNLVLFDCQYDDTYLFGQDGSVLVDNGDVTCLEDYPRQEKQEYVINKGTNSLTIASYPYHVAEISEVQLKLYLINGSEKYVIIYEH